MIRFSSFRSTSTAVESQIRIFRGDWYHFGQEIGGLSEHPVLKY